MSRSSSLDLSPTNIHHSVELVEIHRRAVLPTGAIRLRTFYIDELDGQLTEWLPKCDEAELLALMIKSGPDLLVNCVSMIH